ncbi:MAG TPA: efflux RND transporter permease subunit, partial [Gemmataceae bacterium]|nr:efflux RND transporter permease subunit [Gemmataceae bacterium]
VQGVGDVFLFGQRDYSMRIWVDPDKLYARRLSAADVVAAVQEQNQQVATGAIGQEPMTGRQEAQVTLSTLGRLQEVEQFENIVVKTGREGRLTRIKDIGRVELGAKNQDISVRLDGRPTVFLAIFQMPDANALDVRERVMAKMAELKQSFPDDVDYTVGFDTTPYTRESILEVMKTLRDAVALVAVVVLLFLQNWRSAIIPLVAVPVAIVGTFAAMAAIGFSLNNLTLFGLVLAIGIVVDDAIVVVEAVEHHIELGLPPREATFAAMQQVSGPVIAVGLVLSAVFVPCAFISGLTGAFFRQFALTIAVSTIISAFNSLTLSPALTAILLRPREQAIGAPLPRLAFVLAGAWLGWALTPSLERGVTEWLPAALDWLHKKPWATQAGLAVAGALLGWAAGRPLNYLLGFFFRGFNAAFRKTAHGYVRLVGGLLRVSVIALLLYGGLLWITYKEFAGTRRGFVPSQDMGYLLVTVQLPDSASTERTAQVMRQIEQSTRFLADGSLRRGILHVSGISGMSFVLGANGSNFGSIFVNLDSYANRRDPSLASEAIANDLRREFAKIEGAMVFVFGPPPVRGVGRAGGFAIMIEDRGDFGPHALQEQVDNLNRKANMPDRKETPWLVGPDGGPRLVGLSSVFRANVPQLHIDPNPGACMMRGVSMQNFADTLQVYEGSLYVNDFNRFGRTWQ